MTDENKILPKTEVEIRFQLPSLQEVISIRGEVVRTYRQYVQTWYYSGVKFHDKEEKGIRLLLDFVLGDIS